LTIWPRRPRSLYPEDRMKVVADAYVIGIDLITPITNGFHL
jgi:hypothetical protein